MNMENTGKSRKILSAVSIITVLALAVLATVFVWKWLSSFSGDGFRDYIRSFGYFGWLVLFGVQFLQVFIALIPGEVVETAAGYAFGPLLGTVICYAGVALASALIFWLTRIFGVRLTEAFVSREKINSLKFISTEKKRNFLIFLLFFIPGTPKDLITYFVGLTDIKLSTFLCISLVARTPSVVSSTFGGHLLGEGSYLSALLLYGITGAVSLCGMWIYNKTVKSRQKKLK